MADPLDDLDDILSSPQSRPRTSYLAPAAARPDTSGPPRARPDLTGWGEGAQPGSPAPAPGPPVGRRQRADFDGSAKSATAAVPKSPPRVSSWEDDDNAVIPMIPDLEVVQEEDLALQVAAAPVSRVNRVVTMQELNDDLFKHPTFMALEDIDLQLLTNRLSELADVQEVDKPWVWDVLFTEVLSEVQDEVSDEETAAELPTPKSSASLAGRRAPSGRLKSASAKAQMPYKMM